jgi:hypothetical protein
MHTGTSAKLLEKPDLSLKKVTDKESERAFTKLLP